MIQIRALSRSRPRPITFKNRRRAPCETVSKPRYHVHMIQETRTYIAIGSNIDPRRNIPCCLELLRIIPDSRVTMESSWYLTSPWGIASQPDFINLVVGLETRLSPRQLLVETQAIETRLERLRTLKNGPRTIDLDLLLFGDTVLDEHDLSIPHTGLLLRDFMLIPLIELAPEIIHPARGRPLGELTRELRYRQIIARLPPEEHIPIDQDSSTSDLDDSPGLP